MFGVILKAKNSSFQKGIPFCRSIYVKKVMKLLAFIFEHSSYYLLLLAADGLFTIYSAITTRNSIITRTTKVKSRKFEASELEILFRIT